MSSEDRPQATHTLTKANAKYYDHQDSKVEGVKVYHHPHTSPTPRHPHASPTPRHPHTSPPGHHLHTSPPGHHPHAMYEEQRMEEHGHLQMKEYNNSTW
jgi:hypothetical protein